MFDMRRREFITLLGGAAVTWPLAARAQQPERMRRIGVLMHSRADEPEGQARLLAFLQGLQGAGWVVGQNMRIDYRWAVGDLARLRMEAAELVSPKASTPSETATSRVWRGRAETRLVLSSSNTVWPRNGWSCAKRPRPESLAWASCASLAMPVSDSGS